MEKMDLSQAEKIDIAVGNGCFVAQYSSRNKTFFCFFSSIDLHQLQESEDTPTLLVHAGLVCFVHVPPSSDVDYRIFKVRM